MTPRRLSPADLPWLHKVARPRYPANYSARAAEAWFCEVVMKSPLMFNAARTDNAFCISMLACNPWTPAEFEVHVAALCADQGAVWECGALLRDSIAFARERKACRWHMNSETDFDLAPLARRIGATTRTPRYTLAL